MPDHYSTNTKKKRTRSVYGEGSKSGRALLGSGGAGQAADAMKRRRKMLDDPTKPPRKSKRKK